MATFGKSFSRELGKNSGKWVSNKLFGDSWSTPHRIVIQNREREERKQQRIEAREYKQHLLLEKKLERDLEKQEKEYAREMQQLEKENLIRENLNDVERHNNYINTIQSVHKDYSNPIDWDNLLTTEPPQEVEEPNKMVSHYEKISNEEIDGNISDLRNNLKLSLANKVIGKTYNAKNSTIFNIPKYKIFKTLPMIFFFLAILAMTKSFIFGVIVGIILFGVYYLLKNGSEDFQKIMNTDEEIDYLENQRENLKNSYLEEHTQFYNQYLSDKNDYEELMKISQGVKNNDTNSFMYALNFFKPFEDLKNYGSDISYTFNNGLNVNFFARDKDVVPNFTKKALRNGVEVKDEPISLARYNEIYQDYVCSCVLRVGKEIFSLLPINDVKVNVKGNLLDKSTGNIKDSTILSVKLNRDIIENLNFNLLDPSDSMRNFTHNMIFDKNVGFYEVEEVA